MRNTKREERGTKRAGASVGGQFKAGVKTEATGAGLDTRRVIGRRSIHPDHEQLENSEEQLRHEFHDIAAALDLESDTIQHRAARSAIHWSAMGEPDEVVHQVFDHDRLHNGMEDRGAPAPKRRKCVSCNILVPDGTGRKTYSSARRKTEAICDPCAAKTEFRPPRPEPTLEWDEPIYG